MDCGLTYQQAMDLPQSLILDLIAVKAIEQGGAERKMTGADAWSAMRTMTKMK